MRKQILCVALSLGQHTLTVDAPGYDTYTVKFTK